MTVFCSWQFCAVAFCARTSAVAVFDAKFEIKTLFQKVENKIKFDKMVSERSFKRSENLRKFLDGDSFNFGANFSTANLDNDIKEVQKEKDNAIEAFKQVEAILEEKQNFGEDKKKSIMVKCCTCLCEIKLGSI